MGNRFITASSLSRGWVLSGYAWSHKVEPDSDYEDAYALQAQDEGHGLHRAAPAV